MDEYGFLESIEEAPTPPAQPDDRGDDQDQDQQEPDQPEPTSSDSTNKPTRGLRSGIFRAANIQDKLLDKLVSHIIPPNDPSTTPLGPDEDDIPVFAKRPGFSVPLMTTNFRRFNARIGVVFKFQARVLRLLAWRRPTQTLSLLAVYTFVCLDPYLLLALPLAVALFGVLVPSFVARHPAPTPDSGADRLRSMSYSPRGPPLAPARTVRPTKELSRDFFANLGHLQNVMEDFSVAHDAVVALVVPKTNFSDEALSSALFVVLFGAMLVMLIAAHLLPLRAVALVGGWAAIWSGHPAVARRMRQVRERYNNNNVQTEEEGGGDEKDNKGVRNKTNNNNPWFTTTALQSLLTSDILLDSSPETRQVEIFELQYRAPLSTPDTTPTNDLPQPSEPITFGEWEPWLFTPTPYDPLSADRLAGRRPRGTRFFEDVLPPEGWEWSEKKWALDLWSREWVEERIITGVEVETEGESDCEGEKGKEDEEDEGTTSWNPLSWVGDGVKTAKDMWYLTMNA
ncbi:hypothetical protein VTJ49DRAFT_6175 [Mycothermus thermophilus]|uniref:TECPR1-like DysF domain-containing protein n=1 Tax=Humicola insolens TaxID=85995 RepID=A0ABR3VJE0_HUMIN